MSVVAVITGFSSKVQRREMRMSFRLATVPSCLAGLLRVSETIALLLPLPAEFISMAAKFPSQMFSRHLVVSIIYGRDDLEKFSARGGVGGGVGGYRVTEQRKPSSQSLKIVTSSFCSQKTKRPTDHHHSNANHESVATNLHPQGRPPLANVVAMSGSQNSERFI